MKLPRYLLSLIFATLGLAVVATSAAAEDPVQMTPFRVKPAEMYFKVKYTVATGEVTEVSVTGVAKGSAAEKAGIREGDLLTSVRGVPVAGMKRSVLCPENGRVNVSGLVTFTGRRGLLRRPWSVTVETETLRAKPPTTVLPHSSPSPPTVVVTPPPPVPAEATAAAP